MAFQLVNAHGRKSKITSKYLLELLGDGNESEIEGLEDEETPEEEGIEAAPDQVLGQSYSDHESSEPQEEGTNIQVPERITPRSQRGREDSQRAREVSQRSRGVSQCGCSVSHRHHLPVRSSSTSRGTSRYRTRHRTSRNDQLPDSYGTSPHSNRAQSEVAQRDRDPFKRRLWKCIPFDQKRTQFSATRTTDHQMPLIIANYNRNMGGVDVFDQSIEYYRTFMKTRKWTLKLKVMLHYFDLVFANAWRLYKIHCETARVHKGQVFDLLQFKLQVADGLSNTPDRPRLDQDADENMEGMEAQGPENVDPNIPAKIYRPANVPSEAKRHDGYEHYPVFDEIENPRSCRVEGCSSRSKIRCEIKEITDHRN